MSLIDLEPAKARAGQLFCSCDAASGETDAAAPAAVAQAAAVFALTILVQSLYVAVLPIAGAEITDRPLLATLPYAMTLVGALAASLPAALLSDTFGRRAAFGLGAGIGLAGACLAAWSIDDRQFAGLALGGFWLGIAQGFGFFYRHSAALAGADKARRIAVVLGAGSFAAVAAPWLLSQAQAAAGPLASSAALLIAGAAQIVLLALCFALPGKSVSQKPAAPNTKIGVTYLGATAIGSIAWFGMALIMAGSPGLMAQCGIGLGGRAEIVSWHILAMYAPAAIFGLLLPRAKGEALAIVGIVLLAGAIAILGRLTGFADFGTALIVAGCGWSLAMFGAMLLLHTEEAPSRLLLAFHDAALFSSAILGALAAAFLHQ